jgi:hypothetical protein
MHKNTKLSFLSPHLAAHEGESYYKSRCQNIRTILKEAKTSEVRSKLDVSMTSHHMLREREMCFGAGREEGLCRPLSI